MRIEHIAIWVNDLELMKDFYVKYFNLKANKKYHNPKKNFSSYFLSSSKESCRIELMHNLAIKNTKYNSNEYIGLAHFAFSVGYKKMVIELTEELRNDGYSVVGEPRTTGDGYFESVILDPEGNRIEITE